MQGLQHYTQLHRIKKSELPVRVVKEVFSIFEQVITSETRVAVGVSSGVDSMALVSLLLIWWEMRGFPLRNLRILHCNHKIRKQSEDEAEYVKEFFS